MTAASPATAPTPLLRGVVADLRRHPVKGFTPEAVDRAALTRGEPFPSDRLFAIEAGDCGFDPAAPTHISKSRFAVLANTAALAKVRTRYDDASRRLHAAAPGAAAFEGGLDEAAGRAAFVDWLGAVLGEDAPAGRLRMIPGEGWRFFDAPEGHISLINLASVRDLGRRIGADLDPLRFRANLYLEGWPAWAELDLPAGTAVLAGQARLTVIHPIRRCAATHVDPATAVRDHDLARALHRTYGHMFCGLYLQVKAGGVLAKGGAVETRP